MSDKDILKDAQEEFQAIAEAEDKNRKRWVDDTRFAMLSQQWPEAVRRDRELSGRPCLTINRLPSFIRQVTNDARMNKPSIVTHPVGDGANKQTAYILNGLIRNIEYTSNADVAYDTALEHAVCGGFGYLRVSTEYATEDAFEQDLVIHRVANPLCVYGDAKSTEADSSDWNVSFLTELYTEAEFKRKWPGAEEIDFNAIGLNDQQRDWMQKGKIRVAEYWTRVEVDDTIVKMSNGMVMRKSSPQFAEVMAMKLPGLQVEGDRPTKRMKVMQRIINGCEVLETNDWAGRYIPIIPVYGTEVMVEGERTLKGLIHDAKDAQQMLNYWRTASTELVALAPKAPWVGKRGFAASSPGKWATANTKNHEYLEYDGDTPPIRQAFDGPPAGALQEALNASDDMKTIMGIYDASLGARSNETSGRAIMARQKEGDTSTFNYVDNLSRAMRHLGRILVDMIPHVYTEARIIRVIHPDGSNEPVPINQPLPPGQMPGQPQAQQQNPEQMQQAEGMAGIYDLCAGKYDVTCEVGPSFNTKREEAATQMTEFLRSFPAAAPIIGDLVAKNLDWPGADEISARLKAMLPPQIQGQNPQVQQLQQQMQQMQQQGQQAMQALQQALQQAQQEAAKEKARNDAQMLDKQIDQEKIENDRKKLRIEFYKAVTDRYATGQALVEGASQDLVSEMQGGPPNV